MNKGLKTGLNVILVLAVVFIAFRLYSDIMQPIRFQKKIEYRENIVKDKMMKIRELEIAYLDTYGHYTSDLDTLEDFAKNGRLIVIKATGVVPDSIFTMVKFNKSKAELKALELGIITRDTLRVSVKDSLFRGVSCDTFRYIPYTGLTEDFQLQAGILKTLSNLERPVFELKVHNNSFTKGLDKQSVINLNDAARDNETFPGYIVGSMTEVTTAGNWN